MPSVRIISNESIVNWISCVEDFLDEDDDAIVSFILLDVRWSFCDSSSFLLSNTISESHCEIGILDVVEFVFDILDVVEFVFDILDVGLIGGNSLIVVEAILFTSSLLSDVLVGIVGNEFRLAGDAIEAMELFFEDVRDDFRRFIVVTVIGVGFGRVNFLWERGVTEDDARVNRWVNKCSDGFAELIERIEAMSKSW